MVSPAKTRRMRTGRSAKGGQATKARFGLEFYREIGRKGGKQTMRRHGPKHYAEIGRKGGSAPHNRSD